MRSATFILWTSLCGSRRSTRVSEALAMAVSRRMTVSAFPAAAAGLSPINSKTLLHVLNIVLARFFRLGVVFGVVVAVGHAQAALIHVGDHLLGVVRILRRASRKQHGTGVGIAEVGHLQPRHQRCEFFRRLDLAQWRRVPAESPRRLAFPPRFRPCRRRRSRQSSGSQHCVAHSVVPPVPACRGGRSGCPDTACRRPTRKSGRAGSGFFFCQPPQE